MILWIFVMILSKMYTLQSEVVHQPDPVMMVSVGDEVTLRCMILEEQSDPITWYKQISGHQPCVVAMVQKYAGKHQFYNEFKSSRFTIERDSGICHLKISNVTSSDEAMYYCGWRRFETVYAAGTYLALKGSQNIQNKFNVSIHQHPVPESVHPGDTVTLLCSVLAERRTPEIRMFWLRSDSGKSVPEIIYTRHQSNRCENDSYMQSSTYNLTKIVDQMDTGNYYCAVITCGRILFGNGTKINLKKQVDPVVIVLGVLLGVCVAVITSQAILSHKKERYYCNREQELQDIRKEQPSSQDCDAVHLNYAALHFKKGKTKRERPRSGVFTSVNYVS